VSLVGYDDVWRAQAPTGGGQFAFSPGISNVERGRRCLDNDRDMQRGDFCEDTGVMIPG